jgi:hypothetical protein
MTEQTETEILTAVVSDNRITTITPTDQTGIAEGSETTSNQPSKDLKTTLVVLEMNLPITIQILIPTQTAGLGTTHNRVLSPIIRHKITLLQETEAEDLDKTIINKKTSSLHCSFFVLIVVILQVHF